MAASYCPDLFKLLVFQVKRCKELENRAAALKREVEILRATLRQQKDKVQQLHELLVSREQIHRYMLASIAVNDPPFLPGARTSPQGVPENSYFMSDKIKSANISTVPSM